MCLPDTLLAGLAILSIIAAFVACAGIMHATVKSSDFDKWTLPTMVGVCIVWIICLIWMFVRWPVCYYFFGVSL